MKCKVALRDPAYVGSLKTRRADLRCDCVKAIPPRRNSESTGLLYHSFGVRGCDDCRTSYVQGDDDFHREFRDQEYFPLKIYAPREARHVLVG